MKWYLGFMSFKQHGFLSTSALGGGNHMHHPAKQSQKIKMKQMPGLAQA